MLFEEKFSDKKHFRSVGEFCCGADSPLDTFLSSQAFKYDEQRYGITYILTESAESTEILGFYTLKTSGIQIQENGEYNSIPVIEIARMLGSSENETSNNHAREIISDAIDYKKILNKP